jgi:hypothetical protein
MGATLKRRSKGLAGGLDMARAVCPIFGGEANWGVLQFLKKTFDTHSVLLYQYTHALNQCGTNTKGTHIMITTIVALWLSALAAGIFSMARADRV